MGTAQYTWVSQAACREGEHLKPFRLLKHYTAIAESEGRGLRVDEVCTILGVGRKAVHTMRRRENLRSTVIGRVVYVSPESLAEYLRQEEIDPFFPRASQRRDAERAIAICRTCPVINTCLDHALTNYEDDGIWGGMNAKDRIQLRISMGLRRPPVQVPLLSSDEVAEVRAKYLKNCKTLGHGGVAALAVEYNVSERTIFRTTKGLSAQAKQVA
ncbi:WhiB family transcriptional regulator [Nocardia sp. NPDC051570]|uniref:WhiB family transcriptional regulator n=1 Tax=Nocardia sp. NPDC051570 TaxID=3364324 RepID=UPI0037921075